MLRALRRQALWSSSTPTRIYNNTSRAVSPLTISRHARAQSSTSHISSSYNARLYAGHLQHTTHVAVSHEPRRSYATKKKYNKKRLDDKQSQVPAFVDVLLRLRTALEDKDIDEVIQSYGEARQAVRLGGDDASAIAQALSAAVHDLPEGKEKRVPQKLTLFAATLVEDVQSKTLPPSRPAHFHLLSFFKEARQLDEGLRFWSWLVQQEDSHVSTQIYRIAIELLALKGRPAEDTESLYLRALKRFPGNFNEYHLSANAIVPDRSQPITVTGIPMTLLQGIIKARLLRGDTMNAYLGLDTALRLYPDVTPSRIFSHFIEERPAPEAYKVFLIACRSGVTVAQDTLKTLLIKLRTLSTQDHTTSSFAVRALITAIYLHMTTGGKLAPSHLTEAVIAIASVTNTCSLGSAESSERIQITDRLFTVMRELMHTFSLQNISPGIVAFNTIITNIIGQGKRVDFLPELLADITGLGIQPTAATHRSILTAAGVSRDKDLLRLAWTELTGLRQKVGTTVDFVDWRLFTKAAIRCKDVVYLLEQADLQAHTVTPIIQKFVMGAVQAGEPADRDASRSASGEGAIERTLELIEQISADIAFVTQEFQGNPLWNFYERPLPLSLGEVYQSAVTERKPELQDLYEVLTSDAPSPAENVKEETPKASPAVASTGVPFDELRYQNWRAINELLAEAEERDSVYEEAIDRAIHEGVAPPKRTLGWLPGHSGRSVGLSDFVNPQSHDEHRKVQAHAAGDADADESATRDWRRVSQDPKEIRRLRGL